MIIFTDGSAHPNPGPGGYGVIVYDDNGKLIEVYSKQYSNTKVTNNEMELKGILYIMLKYGKYNPIVYSDSAYSINTLTNWMFSWAKNGWIKSDKKTPENLELIKAYYDLYQKGYRLNLQKVKGHNNIVGNEIVDKLATGKISAEEVYNKYGN